MMQVEQFVGHGAYKPPSTITMKRERDITCVAEDLSMSSTKKVKRTSAVVVNKNKGSMEHIKKEPVVAENSRLPEETVLKTDVITQVMHIQDPLSTLRTLLENRLGVDLSSFQFWLQDKYKLHSQRSLGDQCIQSEGVAQVKVELKRLGGNRINIVDVLKFGDGTDEDDDDVDDSPVEDLSVKRSDSDDNADADADVDGDADAEIPARWTMYEGINNMFHIPLPSDPTTWNQVHMQQWLTWAMQEFKVDYVCESMWKMNGRQLCQMTVEDFRQKVPVDPHNLLWTHIDLLRKCRIFAVLEKNGQRHRLHSQTNYNKPSQAAIRKPRTPSSSSTNSNGNGNTRRPCMTGHNGQIQLWQFLLELLADRSRKNVIQWVGRNGEFKLNDPELVAQMWGERKNKPKMNYEKLSRALRYYYSESMIAKVHGRRFVYKFVCNLKELVGSTAEELIEMVEDDLPLGSD